MGYKYGTKEWPGTKASGIQSPDPSPAYSSLFKLDHPIITESQRAGGDDGFTAGSLTTANFPEKPASSKSSIGKSNYRKKSGDSDKWANIPSSIARQVSTKKAAENQRVEERWR